MIKETIDLLHVMKHYGVSENIEIAKGKYAKPKTVKGAFYKLIRKIKWLKKGL